MSDGDGCLPPTPPVSPDCSLPPASASRPQVTKMKKFWGRKSSDFDRAGKRLIQEISGVRCFPDDRYSSPINSPAPGRDLGRNQRGELGGGIIWLSQWYTPSGEESSTFS